MPLKKHECMLGLGSENSVTAEAGIWARIVIKLIKLGQISQHHPATSDRFYSYPAVMAEQQRHLYEGDRCMIHPFSIFSLTWATIMIFINLAHMSVSTFRLSYIITPINDVGPDITDWILMALNFICWIDIVVKFNTGYVRLNMMIIALDRSTIAGHYLLRWFLIDLLSSTPIALALLYMSPHRHRALLIAHYAACLRCARLYTVLVDVKVLMKIWTKSYIWHGCVRQSLVFIVSSHWCSCLLFQPSIIMYYWFDDIPTSFNTFLNRGEPPIDIYRYSVGERYRKGYFTAMSAFFGTGFSMLVAFDYSEMIPNTIIILYAAIFIMYNLVFLLKIYVTIYGSTVRYLELTNQVEEYMRHKQFPLSLKKRIRDFYYYRYQEKYFNEGHVLEFLSESLRNEIVLHTCSKLVKKVALFQDAEPHVMGSIIGCLQPQVYLPNESVVRAGDTGDCMFFVANGTVAIYSLKGAEVCHLEDGAHFGEVALLMKDSKRVATVIAIEITLLYKLGRNDFKQFIMSNELLCERIEALASQRMHETVVIDDEFHLQRMESAELLAAKSQQSPLLEPEK